MSKKQPGSATAADADAGAGGDSSGSDTGDDEFNVGKALGPIGGGGAQPNFDPVVTPAEWAWSAVSQLASAVMSIVTPSRNDQQDDGSEDAGDSDASSASGGSSSPSDSDSSTYVTQCVAAQPPRTHTVVSTHEQRGSQDSTAVATCSPAASGV